jgi:hypothetical protein
MGCRVDLQQAPDDAGELTLRGKRDDDPVGACLSENGLQLAQVVYLCHDRELRRSAEHAPQHLAQQAGIVGQDDLDAVIMGWGDRCSIAAHGTSFAGVLL